MLQRQALSNLKAVLEAAGSDLKNVLKVNVFITTMDDFATMNEAYDEFFTFDPKPVRTTRPVIFLLPLIDETLIGLTRHIAVPDLCCCQAIAL